MNINILQSKIVSTPTDSTWAQAYSTLNLYIVVSIQKRDEDTKSIGLQGKEILERLTREYFALDEKTLITIKKAVENIREETDGLKTFSIVLTTIIENIMYIITFSKGVVTVKRGEHIGPVAQGEEGKITGFSGELEENDIILIETASFAEKLPPSKLHQFLTPNVVEVSENLMPFVHENSRGTEAAIILRYKSIVPPSPLEEEFIEDVVVDKSADEQFPAPPQPLKNVKNISTHEIFSKISFPSFGSSLIRPLLKKRVLIALAVFVLIGLFAYLLISQKQRESNKRQDQLLQSILEPNQKKYEEAVGLAALNKSLANASLISIQEDISKNEGKFSLGTSQRKKLDEFKTRVDNKAKELDGQAVKKNQQELLEGKEVTKISAKGDTIEAINSTGTLYILGSDGTVKDSFETSVKNPKHITADTKLLYILGENAIYAVDKGNKKTKKIIPDSSQIAYIDTFLGNIYALNVKSDDIEKYAGASYQKSSYLDTSASLNNALSISIDSSIWTINGSGTIKKFTRGKEESFSIKGLSRPFGKGAVLYTDASYANIYILDSSNSRLTVFNKTGEYQTQYELSALKNATSFSVDEGNKKAYVVENNKLYSFDL